MSILTCTFDVPLALSHGLQWGQKLYDLAYDFFTFVIKISEARESDNKDVVKTNMAKGGFFFQKVRFVFQISKYPKKITPNHYPELEIWNSRP